MTANLDAANRFLLDTLSSWVAATGEQSGAQNFYLRRLGGGIMIEPYEVAVGCFLVRTLDVADQSYEVGCGYGQLPFWVAWGGRRMAGLERASGRFGGAQFLLSTLGEFNPDAAERLSFQKILFPTEFNFDLLADNRRNALVFTNVVSTAIKQQEEAILTTFARFNIVIVMVSHFGWHRSKAEQRDLERKIRNSGMIFGEEIFVDEDRRIVSFIARSR
jgi:hypothetical protein